MNIASTVDPPGDTVQTCPARDYKATAPTRSRTRRVQSAWSACCANTRYKIGASWLSTIRQVGNGSNTTLPGMARETF
jgi:hypothetical protein